PVDTPIPDPEVTPEDQPVRTSTPGGGSSQASAEGELAFDSNLRAGPGLSFDVIDQARAGTTLPIVGRDVLGRWLLVRTADGLEAWAALIQFEQPLSILNVPVAGDIPVAPPTVAAADDPPAASVELFFELPVGGEPVCQEFVQPVGEPFAASAPGQSYVAFDAAAADQRQTPLPVYVLDRIEVPAFVELTVDGPVTAGGCDETGAECFNVRMRLCAAAGEGAGGSELTLENEIGLALGTQQGPGFSVEAAVEFPVTFAIAGD